MPSNYRNNSSKKAVTRKKSPSPSQAKNPEKVESRDLSSYATTGDPLLKGRQWKALMRMCFERHGTVCHLCGHGGSDSADHVVPRAEDPSRSHDLTNLRPVHHKPCPSCGLRCNNLRGALSVEAGKRKIRERQEQRLTEMGEDTGREW